MSITGLFSKLDAPLVNSRWSWGSVRATDGVVILRVWQDKKTRLNDHWYMMITHHDKHKGEINNLGYKERNKQVELVKSGAPCYMIMCQAVDIKAVPRKIKSFNKNDIFIGGKTIEKDGDTWIEMLDRVPVKNINTYQVNATDQ